MRNIKALAWFAVLALTAVPAFATDGSLSTTSSQGTTELTLTVPSMVKITGIEDPLVKDDWDGTGDLVANDSVCVFANHATGAYNITATGDGAAGHEFNVANGANNADYTVNWNDGSGNDPLTHNVAFTADNASTVEDCSASTNATFTVTIAHATAIALPPKVYTGTLTLTVTPAS